MSTIISVPRQYDKRGNCFYCDVPFGLYRVHWLSGGSSLAAIGQTSNGKMWIAPVNWVNQGVIENKPNEDGSGIGWSDIIGLDLLHRYPEDL